MEDRGSGGALASATRPAISARRCNLPYRIRDWDKHFENCASRKLTRLSWVAIPNKTDGEGYTALVDHPNAGAHLGAWYAIVEAASKQDPRGNLPGGIPRNISGISRSLGRMSRLPAELFMEVIPRLIEIGWIECFQSDTETSADSPDASAESPERIEGNGIEGNGKEQTPLSAKAAQETLFPTVKDFLEVPPDPPIPVRSVVPAGPNFEDFWAVWWNKTAKAKTQKLWPSAATRYGARFLVDAAIADRARFEPAPSWEWRSQMHPTTWLNGKRWEDEVTPNGKSSMILPNGKPPNAVDRALELVKNRIANGERPI